MRIGLVLGAGGVTGHAFHVGVLQAVEAVTGWNPRSADVVVGTSAGSVVGALLRADVDDIRPRPPERSLIPATGARAPRPFASPELLLRSGLRPWTARFGKVAAATLPEGRVSTELIVADMRALFDGWTARPLWINAMRLDSGARVTFGRDGAPTTDVATAIAASCAIPSFFAPVEIDGVRYVDGGAHSPTNADLLAGEGLDLVVVSSPMSITATTTRFALDTAGRRLSRYYLAQEVGRVRKAGTPVITFQPTPADLAVMGINAMDASRRLPIIEQVAASARARLERPDAAERIARLAS
ncbi:MAG: patatin-like phospholipase family protein [Actinomycetota bacterium]|nr:patatin-like phospholipase family protein [Actinomycetota bacterium]